ncbi:MAG: class II histone deacetylase [Alphaproteobacteria bacterium]
MTAEPLHVFWHPDVLKHDIGPAAFEIPTYPFLAVAEQHVEGPDRVRNMHSILARGPLKRHLKWHRGRKASRDELLTFHTESYLKDLEQAAKSGGKWYTRTTFFTSRSMHPVAVAAGTALAAADHVMSGKAAVAYALVRPPGHHASPDTADGYCFINNTALAAQRARDRGAKRVAILDWDVHHGNGTQEGFYDRDDVLTVSFHMDHGAWHPKFHPQTGKADEIGRGRGRGFNLNVPLPMGTGDGGYLKAMREIVIPAVNAFRPEMIVIANGQDANQFDPNGRQLVTMDGFRALANEARSLARRHTGGRLIVVQEGGYQVTYAALCMHASIEGLLGIESTIRDKIAFYPEDLAPATAAIKSIKRTRSRLLGRKPARGRARAKQPARRRA